jgi:hypothetical protein
MLVVALDRKLLLLQTNAQGNVEGRCPRTFISGGWEPPTFGISVRTFYTFGQSFLSEMLGGTSIVSRESIHTKQGYTFPLTPFPGGSSTEATRPCA